MPKYKYQARLADGKKQNGTMEVRDETELQQRLRDTDAFLLSSVCMDRNKRKKTIKAKLLSEFARELGNLLNAGVTLVRAFSIMLNAETLKPRQRRVYEEVLKKVKQGTSLSDALEAQNGAFPPLMVHMFRSSESSGNLDQVSLQLAELYEKEHKLNAKIKSSTTYPKILAVMILLVIVVITRFVLPQFAELLGSMDSIPTATKALLSVSDFMESYWYVVIAAAALIIIGFRAALAVPNIRYVWHKMKLRMPLIGKLQKSIYTSRFARTLSSLYTAGIPLITALEIAKKTIGNDYIESQFPEIIHFVRSGNALSDGIAMIDGFVKKLADAVRVGEETGKLDTMLKSTADILEYDADIAITKMVSYVEPVMILIMGVVVALVMAAVFSALFGSYDAIAEI